MSFLGVALRKRVLLMEGVIGIVVTRACTGRWAGRLLCSLVVTALLGAGSTPQLLEKIFRSSSKVWCVVDRTGALPLGKEPLCIPPQELSTSTCTLISPVIWCGTRKVNYHWHCTWPCLHSGQTGNWFRFHLCSPTKSAMSVPLMLPRLCCQS